ncbi:MAG: PD40 domain-containing protein [Myxococcales bacterium]|nr:PD40 domain-containing protein [Myxococcales bacterium]
MRAWIFAPALALVLATAAAACVGDDPVGSQDAGATPADASTAPTDAPTNVPDTSTPVPDAGADTSAPRDGAVDTGTDRRCDPAKTFDAPTFMATVSSAFDEASFSMTRDELTAFMHRENTGAPNTSLLQTTRARVTDAFAAPTETNLAVVNTPPGSEYSPTVSPDGLVLYFHRQTAGGIGVFVATRGAAGAPFANQGAVTVGGTALSDALSPHLSADGQTLYWLDFQTFKLHQAARGATPAIFGTGREVTPADVYNPVLSADELTLYYSNGMSDDVLRATRASKAASFGAGVRVDALSSNAKDAPLFLTGDGCVMILKSTRPGGSGGTDLWMAQRPQ